jgi:pimeloyl-ACP methyl ester carboxylesterase
MFNQATSKKINFMDKSSINLKIFALIILFFMASTISVNAQQVNHMENSKTSGYAPVNDLKMYYEVYGTGAVPLVLIHGGGSTIATSFGKLLPLLSGQAKVIAVELQAHGHTSDRDAPESFEQDADDVAALLTYLKVDKANFLGFSNGGTTTLQIAIRHPEIVNKIVVVSGNYRRDGMIPGFFDGFANATLAMMPESLKEAYLKVAPDKNHLQTMFEKDVARMETFKDIPDDVMQTIKAPAMIIISDHDVIMREHGVKMSRIIPGAELVVLPGVHGSSVGALEAGPGKKGSKLPEITANLVEVFLNE